MNRAARLGCIAICLIALSLLTGCWVPSINALYVDSDTFYDDTLEGTWKADDGNSAMTFGRNSAGTCYLITYAEQAEGSKFEGCLTQIGKAVFLDIAPAEQQQPEALQSHFLPLHSFWRVETGADTLSLQGLDERWFQGKAAKKRLGLATAKAGDGLLLTASTTALRNFFKRYGETDEVFAGKNTFHRQK